ncbi:MAG: hypothetical protein FWG35_02195, partial [Spirochaetaceae bacterium]|nr:hypothetical protein [Spirochaetaceae bacterium]
PALVSCGDDTEEAAFCLSLIRKNPSAETAILYRTNAQSRVFETLFAREGVPYRIVGTLRFYEREEIKDVLAFLKFMANPRDEVSFRRIINKPARGLGDAGVNKILAAGESGADIGACLEKAAASLSGKAAAGLAAFTTLQRSLAETLNEKPFGDFVTQLIKDSGLEEYHKTRDEVTATQKLQNLEELVNAASVYPGGLAGLTQFLEDVELDSARVEQSPASSRTSPATLITMHNTKGLEFDRVIITGLEDGLFPKAAPSAGPFSEKAPDDREELEEERRLFYVAITRARRELYFTCCAMRRVHGQPRFMEASRFLEELPEEIRARDALRQNRSQGWGRNLDDGAFRPGGPKEKSYPSAEVFSLQPGTTVYHEDYGQGIVVKSRVSDGSHVVSVRFDSGKTHEFLPKYERRLERVQVDGL